MPPILEEPDGPAPPAKKPKQSGPSLDADTQAKNRAAKRGQGADAFEHARLPSVAIVPAKTTDGSTSQSEDVLLVDGDTYHFRDALKEKGFSYQRDFNGDDGANVWVAPAADVEADDVAALFEEWGWQVEVFDGLEEDDDE